VVRLNDYEKKTTEPHLEDLTLKRPQQVGYTYHSGQSIARDGEMPLRAFKNYGISCPW